MLRVAAMTPALLLIAALVAGLSGLGLLRRNGPGWRVGRLLAVAPVVPLAEAVAFAQSGEDHYVRVHGRIDSEEEFPDADDNPIVFRRRRLQQASRRDAWNTIDDERLSVPFGLADKGDTLMIDSDALGDGLIVVPRLSEGVASDIPADAFSGPPLDLPPETRVRMRIDQVSSVEHATAAGVPTRASDGTLTLTAGMARPLILTTLDPDEAMRVLGSSHRHSILAGSLLLLAAGALLMAALVAVLLNL